MEENNEIRLIKIPLRIFIETLTDLYVRGAGYIDIIGRPNETQDYVGIAVKEEYLSFPDDDFIEEITEIRRVLDLDEEDINDLI